MNLMTKLLIGSDARSKRGTFARGKPIYPGGATGAHTGKKTMAAKMQAAANRRLKK